MLLARLDQPRRRACGVLQPQTARKAIHAVAAEHHVARLDRTLAPSGYCSMASTARPVWVSDLSGRTSCGICRRVCLSTGYAGAP